MILAQALFHTAVFHPWVNFVQVQSQRDKNSSIVVRSNQQIEQCITYLFLGLKPMPPDQFSLMVKRSKRDCSCTPHVSSLIVSGNYSSPQTCRMDSKQLSMFSSILPTSFRGNKIFLWWDITSAVERCWRMLVLYTDSFLLMEAAFNQSS